MSIADLFIVLGLPVLGAIGLMIMQVRRDIRNDAALAAERDAAGGIHVLGTPWK